MRERDVERERDGAAVWWKYVYCVPRCLLGCSCGSQPRACQLVRLFLSLACARLSSNPGFTIRFYSRNQLHIYSHIAMQQLRTAGWCRCAAASLLLLTNLPTTWSLASIVHVTGRAADKQQARTTRSLVACQEEGGDHAQARLESRDVEAIQLLDMLEGWMRQQKIASICSRGQATDLLEAFRADRRFWAQQRRQFTRVWTSILEGLEQESRPLSAVLGESTSSRFLEALEEMDEDPALVDAVLRSEVVEKMLGHVALRKWQTLVGPRGRCLSGQERAHAQIHAVPREEACIGCTGALRRHPGIRAAG